MICFSHQEQIELSIPPTAREGFFGRLRGWCLRCKAAGCRLSGHTAAFGSHGGFRVTVSSWSASLSCFFSHQEQLSLKSSNTPDTSYRSSTCTGMHTGGTHFITNFSQLFLFFLIAYFLQLHPGTKTPKGITSGAS